MVEGDKKIYTIAELNKLKDKYYWTIINRNVYNLKSWMKAHPGGDLVLRHCLYKDSTDEFLSFHPQYVVDQYLPKFCIGTLHPNETVISDSELSKDFLKLAQSLRDKKLFETNLWKYVGEIVKCTILFLMSMYVLFVYAKYNDSYLTYLLASFLLGACWHQIAFVGHDLGHNSVTQHLTTDHVIAILLANLFGGISIGWWKDTHYVHHTVTNDPEHDPDIQLLPFLAVTPRLFQNIFSTYHNKILEFDLAAKILVRIQNYLYYIIMMFGRINLYVQSYLFLLFNKRARMPKLELTGLILFAIWYGLIVSYIPGTGKKLFFVFVSHAITALLHVQITLSHYAMSTDVRGEKEEFVKFQLRTTMDVNCYEWLDWLHGGLQYQVVHHLFPRLPRHNLRKASYELIKFCKEHYLEYKRYSFFTGNVVIISHLSSVAKKVI
jgi:delta8-fatty-acid desaturase